MALTKDSALNKIIKLVAKVREKTKVEAFDEFLVYAHGPDAITWFGLLMDDPDINTTYETYRSIAVNYNNEDAREVKLNYIIGYMQLDDLGIELHLIAYLDSGDKNTITVVPVPIEWGSSYRPIITIPSSKEEDDDSDEKDDN